MEHGQQSKHKNAAQSMQYERFCDVILPPQGVAQKLEKDVAVDFNKTPRTEGWDKVRDNVNRRFAAGLPFLVPEILEFQRNQGYS